MANGNGNSFITGFLIGGVVGAVVGIMLAPKSGSETRAELLEQSEALRVPRPRSSRPGSASG